MYTIFLKKILIIYIFKRNSFSYISYENYAIYEMKMLKDEIDIKKEL